MSTRPASSTTMTKDCHAKAVAIGSMLLTWLQSILVAAWQTVPV